MDYEVMQLDAHHNEHFISFQYEEHLDTHQNEDYSYSPKRAPWRTSSPPAGRSSKDRRKARPENRLSWEWRLLINSV